MTPRAARYALGDILTRALPSGWTVYPAPPEGVTAPAVVIAPGEPYRVRSTVCNESVRLTVTLLMSRNASSAGIDALDDMATLVRAAIHDSQLMAAVEQVAALGSIASAGGLDYLTVRLDVALEL